MPPTLSKFGQFVQAHHRLPPIEAATQQAHHRQISDVATQRLSASLNNSNLPSLLSYNIMFIEAHRLPLERCFYPFFLCPLCRICLGPSSPSIKSATKRTSTSQNNSKFPSSLFFYPVSGHLLRPITAFHCSAPCFPQQFRSPVCLYLLSRICLGPPSPTIKAATTRLSTSLDNSHIPSFQSYSGAFVWAHHRLLLHCRSAFFLPATIPISLVPSIMIRYFGLGPTLPSIEAALQPLFDTSNLSFLSSYSSVSI